MNKLNYLRHGLLLAFVFTALLTFAQNTFPVTGKITDRNGQPVESVTIQEKGTSNTVLTDQGGNFRINLSSGNAILVLSSVGFTALEVPVQNRSVINYTLSEAEGRMQDIVVVGYGTRKRAELTSSIVSVGAEDIRSRPVVNALQAIQGKAAGVDITSNERPGEAGSILIRGVRSIGANNGPLFVVDNVPLNFGGINAINPNDIETIDILKDASATAIYGSRGANGVVLITTKRGKNGTLTINYVGTVTAEKQYDRVKMMNAGEYVEFRRNAYRRVRYLNPNASAGSTYPDQPTLADDRRIFGQDPIAFANIEKGWVNGVWNPTLVPTTNWTDYALQTALTQDHTISVSGGSQNVRAYGSFGFLNNEGTQRGQSFKRYSAKFSVDLTPAKWFSMGGSVNTAYGLQNFGFSTTNATGPGNIYFALQGMLPYAVPYDSTGKRILLPGGDINIVNPVDENNYNVNLRKTLRVIGSVYAEVKLLKGLRYRVNFGPDFQNYYNGRWMDLNSINRGGGNPGSTNYAQLNQSNNLSWTLDNLVYFDRTFSGAKHSHDIGITLLQSALYNRSESSSMFATKLPLPNQKWYALNSVSALDGFSTGLSENSLTSYMARVSYSLDQKYLLNAFIRWDGASPLAAGRKWDMFPSISVGWRLEKESFLENVRWIDQLKLRAGIATVGNAAVDPYTTLGALQGLYYTYGSSAQLGYVPSDPTAANPATYPDQNLGWEHTTQVNIGLDYSFFKGRLSGALDVYKTKTTDLLLYRALNPVMGYQSILTNIGSTKGSGVDFTLTSENVRGKDFNWSTTLNLSYSKEKINELAYGKQDDLANLWFIGQRVGVFYDFEQAGIWQNTREDLDAIAKYKANGQTFNPGDIKVVDQNGDFKIDATNDRVLRGNRLPNLITGMTNDLTYKNWGLSVFIFSRTGFTVATGAESLQGRFTQRQLDYWTPSNPTNNYPSPNYNSAAGDVYRNAMNYQDGSFIKVRNITLSYNMSSAQSKKWHMQNLKLYVQALSPGLIYSKVSWIDPDLGGSTFNRGLVLGVNATF
ncbi:MAG TPA: TonB-dependent receptor [Flavisolibacter sp.]|nr:TonB-dependent receptor [Flavisolibacter sp.]